MPEPLSNEPVVITDHRAVDLLMNLKATQRLAPFMQAEHTLGSAAAEARVPASSLAYWVGRFVAAGLVAVTRHQPRAGKPIPHYRATATEFRVPFEAMPPGARETLFHGGRRHMFEQFIAASDRAAERYYTQGLRVRAHPDRGMELSVIEPEDEVLPPVTEWWGTATLNAEEAAEVHRILEDVRTRLGRDLPGPGRDRYVMVLGFAPAPRAR
jgi:hypothetical protein